MGARAATGYSPRAGSIRELIRLSYEQTVFGLSAGRTPWSHEFAHWLSGRRPRAGSTHSPRALETSEPAVNRSAPIRVGKTLLRSVPSGPRTRPTQTDHPLPHAGHRRAPCGTTFRHARLEHLRWTWAIAPPRRQALLTKPSAFWLAAPHSPSEWCHLSADCLEGVRGPFRASRATSRRPSSGNAGVSPRGTQGVPPLRTATGTES